MITLFTGMPGAGKTASMLDLLRRECGDRPLFVHYDPESRKRPEQKLLHESLLLDHQTVLADRWHLDVPDGSVLVIDEVQDAWRPRGPATKVPECIQALETHRHAGIDIFVTTQAPRLVDANLRGLVGRHVHIRDTGWFGRWWYEWPETNQELNWKTCPHKKRYKLPKKIFDFYQSANVHTKPIREVPKLALFAIALVIASIFLAFMVVRSINKHANPDAVKPEKVAIATSSDSVVPGQSNFVPGRKLIDDRADWIPRVSGRPESAPAYDELRKVVAMPRVTGAICVNAVCTCYTQQNTVSELPESDCAAWVQRKPFDPYKADEVTAGAHRPQPEPQSQPPAQPFKSPFS